MIESLEHALME